MEFEALAPLLALAAERPSELPAALDGVPASARTFLVVTLESLFGLHGACSFGEPPWCPWGDRLTPPLVERWATKAVRCVPPEAIDGLVAWVLAAADGDGDAIAARMAAACAEDTALAERLAATIPSARRFDDLARLEVAILRGDPPRVLTSLVKRIGKQKNFDEAKFALEASVRALTRLATSPPDHPAVEAGVLSLLALQKKNLGRRMESCTYLARAVAICAGAASAREPRWLEHAATLEAQISGRWSMQAAGAEIARATARLQTTGERAWTTPPPPPDPAPPVTLANVERMAFDHPITAASRAHAASRLVYAAVIAGDVPAGVAAVRAGALGL